MSSPNDSATSRPAPAKKPDLISVPTAAVLVACVIAAIGNRDDSALLTWQIPLALVLLSFAYVGLRAMRARR